MALGLPALTAAKKKVKYLNEVMILDREEEIYVTSDK